jgi:hypothetical protein
MPSVGEIAATTGAWIAAMLLPAAAAVVMALAWVTT